MSERALTWGLLGAAVIIALVFWLGQPAAPKFTPAVPWSVQRDPFSFARSPKSDHVMTSTL